MECQLNHVPANLAYKIPATKFMAKVPTAAECECVLCTVKLMTTKDRWSLHNVANGDVLRYLVEMVHDKLIPGIANFALFFYLFLHSSHLVLRERDKGANHKHHTLPLSMSHTTSMCK